MASKRRVSNFPGRVSGAFDRPGSRDQNKEEIWKPMLDKISGGKRLPEKSLLVLGATPHGAIFRATANVRFQAAPQKHKGNSWNQYQRSRRATGGQTAGGSRQSRISSHWDIRIRMCWTPTMKVHDSGPALAHVANIVQTHSPASPSTSLRIRLPRLRPSSNRTSTRERSPICS